MIHDKAIQGADFSAPLEVCQAPCGSNESDVAIVPNEHPDAIKALLGEWYDHDLDFIGPEGDALTDALLAAIESVAKPRGKARRPNDAANHRALVRKIAANGFHAFNYHNPPLVAVRRKGNGYKDRGQPGLSGTAMRRETSLLERAGLIVVNKGRNGEASTTYCVTEQFLVAAMQARITEMNLSYRLPLARLVRVYETNGRDGRLANFDNAGEAHQWIEQIDAWNGFIVQQQIGIALSEAETARLTTRMNLERRVGIPRLICPDLTKRCLYRQFSNGSFEAGGRLYGAWWINCPKALRPSIVINGKQTVELDFSGCAIRMLYHENDQECVDDPYYHQEIDVCERENGLPNGHFREDVKRMTQALINGRRGGSAERIILPPNHTFRPYFTRSQVMMMIKIKHASISHAFQTGAWGRLQRADSDIALEVITNLKVRNVVALPIHDSFIVQIDQKEELRQEMSDRYLKKCGFNPVVQ